MNLEIQRRTWEIELLISGAVVFTLLGVPGWLDHTFETIEVHLSAQLFLVPYLAYFALKTGSYILILAFVTHLVTRAFWIGLIGLQAAFPEGIDWRNVRYGPRVRAFYRRRLPPVDRLIKEVDVIGSSIFSASFFFVVMFFYTALMSGVLLIPSFAIDQLFFDGEQLPLILVISTFAFFLPPSLATLVDKAGMGKSWGRAPWLRKFVDRTMAVYYPLSPNHLTGPIQFTFFSRLSKAVLYPAMYGIMIGTMLVFLASVLSQRGSAVFQSYLYAHESMGSLGVDPDHYEELRAEGEIYRVTPSIPSEIVTGPYVKLFLPYSPRVHNALVAEICPDLEPLQSEGLAFGRDDEPEPEHLAQALGCLAGLYEVDLDGVRIDDLDALFYRHPETGVRGLVTYLSTRGLAPGRHLIEIERREGEDEDPSRRRQWSIPFWL